MSNNQFDVIIIGSGAGGGSSAYALAKKGHKVLILEAGPYYDPLTDYKLHSASWEKDGFPHKANSEAKYEFGEMQPLHLNHQKLRSWNHNSGFLNPSENRIGWKHHHALGVGGSTLKYTGEAHRINPNSMKLRSDFQAGADWPLSYDELEPFYCEAEKLIGVSGPLEQSFRSRSQPYPLPVHNQSYMSKKVGEGVKKLNLKWEPNSVAILSHNYDNRPTCNYCGNCNKGCPRSDKGSVDVTFIKKALKYKNCTLLALTKVLKIIDSENGEIKAVMFADKDQKIQSATSKIVILSAGVIQGPRLLLNSKSEHSPSGVANSSGQVGKNLMETLSWTSSGLHPEQLNSYKGIPSDSICWNFNQPDSIKNTTGGCRFSLSVAESDLLGPVNYAKRVAQGWGLNHKKQMRQNFGHVMSITGVGEKLPNEGSFVSLAYDKKDEFGLPFPKINSFIASNDINMLYFMREKCQQILTSSGVKKIFEEYSSYDFFSSTQTVGTCRMGINPKTSVVNSYGQSHDSKNLFILDASIFPSSGGGEAPSLTIQALTLRSSKYIDTLLSRS